MDSDSVTVVNEQNFTIYDRISCSYIAWVFNISIIVYSTTQLIALVREVDSPPAHGPPWTVQSSIKIFLLLEKEAIPLREILNIHYFASIIN